MSLSVLVVEDDPLTRLTIVSMLEALKYRVVDVRDADTALSVLQGVWFDIMVASLKDDAPDEKRVVWEAKALQSHIKVVVVSGAYLEPSLHPSVDAFVLKPFSLDQIDAAIKSVRAELESKEPGLLQ
jgi:CheY-like chemotaxis protein